MKYQCISLCFFITLLLGQITDNRLEVSVSLLKDDELVFLSVGNEVVDIKHSLFLPNSWDQPVRISSFIESSDKSCIAVGVLNTGGASGIMGTVSVGDIVVATTDSSWKCSSKTVPGWSNCDFDDSNWKSPSIDSGPWDRRLVERVLNGESGESIWDSSTNSSYAYCRKVFSLNVKYQANLLFKDDLVSFKIGDGSNSGTNLNNFYVNTQLKSQMCVSIEAKTKDSKSAGIMSSIKWGDKLLLRTDGSWKCSSKYETGWDSCEYDDSNWEYAATSKSPFSSTNISNTFNHLAPQNIWAVGDSTVAYCRKTFESAFPRTDQAKKEICLSDHKNDGHFDQKCQPSYVYQGRYYDGCTIIHNNGIPWCATSVDSNNYYNGQFGKCSSYCKSVPMHLVMLKDDYLINLRVGSEKIDTRRLRGTDEWDKYVMVNLMAELSPKVTISVEVLNWGGPRGFMLYAYAYDKQQKTKPILKTDTSWKCSPVYQPNWDEPDFDDSHWDNGRVTEHSWNNNTLNEAFPGKDYPTNIWSSDNFRAYCRKTFSTIMVDSFPPCAADARDGFFNDSCVFPFEYVNTIYNSCTTDDNNGTPWCATVVDHVGTMVQWGNCAKDCSVNDTPTNGGNNPDNALLGVGGIIGISVGLLLLLAVAIGAFYWFRRDSFQGFQILKESFSERPVYDYAEEQALNDSESEEE